MSDYRAQVFQLQGEKKELQAENKKLRRAFDDLIRACSSDDGTAFMPLESEIAEAKAALEKER